MENATKAYMMSNIITTSWYKQQTLVGVFTRDLGTGYRMVNVFKAFTV